MKKLSAVMLTLASTLTFNSLCGIPYAALPITTALSLEGNYPMIMCRKATKDHGTKKMVEGKFEKGQICLLIEDVITSGASILETTVALKKQELEVTDAIVIFDREQGGKQKLSESGIKLHALISIFDLLKVLSEEKKISDSILKEVMDFLGNR